METKGVISVAALWIAASLSLLAAAALTVAREDRSAVALKKDETLSLSLALRAARAGAAEDFSRSSVIASDSTREISVQHVPSMGGASVLTSCWVRGRKRDHHVEVRWRREGSRFRAESWWERP
jgi:hypothetical protein